jgi:anti-anti-sigma factor
MRKDCTITIHRTAGGYLFRVAGRGTMRESPAVRDFVCGAIEDGADTVLDLSECEYLDSTFLGCLVMLHERGKSHKGSFGVVADDSTRKRLLHTIGLDRLLTFADGCPQTTGDCVELKITELERLEFGEHLLETHRKLAELGGPAAAAFHKVADELAQDIRKLKS